MNEDFSEKRKILPKIGSKKTNKEKKQARLVLLFVFCLTLLLVGISLSYRKIPEIIKRINEPVVVSSKQFSSLPTATPTPIMESEKKAVEALIAPLRGTYGVYFRDLESNSSFSINGSVQMNSASLMKMPVLLTLFREYEAGRIKLDTVYKLQAEDKRGGAGSLGGRPVGFEITYREMAKLMGEQSDNTAFNIIGNKILGEAKIQETIDKLGMKQTSYKDFLTSPEDMGLFFRKLYLEKIISDKSRDEILKYITKTIWEDRIPAGIPTGVVVAHKIGSDTGVISDAGIIFAKKPFILVIMSENVNEAEAKEVLPKIAKTIYEMWEK